MRNREYLLINLIILIFQCMMLIVLVLVSEETYCMLMYYNEEDLREDFPAETKFDSIKLMADYYYDNIWLGFVVEEDEREEIIIIGNASSRIQKIK